MDDNWRRIQPLLQQPGGAKVWLVFNDQIKLGANIQPKGNGYTVTLLQSKMVRERPQYMDAAGVLEMLHEHTGTWTPMGGTPDSKQAMRIFAEMIEDEAA
jgi:hypothetical protein